MNAENAPVESPEPIRERQASRIGFLGPGLVSAAANNDPTTVAALLVVGATTGYELCWLVLLLIPMLAVVQSIAATVGGVCRTGLQKAIRNRYGLGWSLATLCAVAVVNVITLAADIKAGGEAMSLLSGIGPELFIVPFVVIVGWMLVNNSYGRIERYLALLPLTFVCYVGSAVFARADLGAFLRGVFVPHLTFSPQYTAAAIALLGTTLTGYVYIWESVEVAERRPERSSIRAFKKDAVIGMVTVGVMFLFIIATSAATLGRYNLPIQTASDAAATLKPLAGPWAGTLFGIGLLGSAILAVPVIAGTTAYVAAETFGWNASLNCTFGEAKRFYGVMLLSLAIGAAAAFVPVSPISLLYWASIAGGFATPITLIFLIRVARDRATMGTYRLSGPLAASALGITGLVVAATLAFFVSLLLVRPHP